MSKANKFKVGDKVSFDWKRRQIGEVIYVKPDNFIYSVQVQFTNWKVIEFTKEGEIVLNYEQYPKLKLLTPLELELL